MNTRTSYLNPGSVSRNGILLFNYPYSLKNIYCFTCIMKCLTLYLCSSHLISAFLTDLSVLWSFLWSVHFIQSILISNNFCPVYGFISINDANNSLWYDLQDPSTAIINEKITRHILHWTQTCLYCKRGFYPIQFFIISGRAVRFQPKGSWSLSLAFYF